MADDYAGVPDTSSNQTDTGSQPTPVTPAATPPATNPQPTPQSNAGVSSDGDPVLQEALKAYDSDRARENEAQTYYDQMRTQISEVNQRIRNSPIPQVPEHMQIPAPPDQTRQQNGGIGTILAQALMIAGIGAAVFGKRHNPWATAALTGSVGSFIEGYTKSQHEAATEQLQNWNRSVEYAQKMNQEADRTYNETLANKRLDTTQQMDLIKTIAAQRADVEMYKAATSKDLNQVIRVLNDHVKAQAATGRMQLDVNSRAAAMWLKGKVGQGWSMYVYEKSGGKLDPTKSNENLLSAMKQYPISEWMDTHTASGATKKSAEKPPSYDSLAKEATRVLGKDNATGWTKTLQNDEPFERGNVVEKEQTTGGFFGLGASQEKVKTWQADPKGIKYTYGDSDEDKIKNAAPFRVIDALATQYDKLKSGTGGTQKGGGEEKYPTLTTQTVREYPAGTVFKDPQGNTRRIISQNPLQVTPPLSSSDTESE